MAELQPNEFTSYLLTDEEDRQGAIFSLTQEQRLRTKLSAIASEKIDLVFDHTSRDSIMDYIDKNSYYQGQLDLLRLLIAESEEARHALENPNPDY